MNRTSLLKCPCEIDACMSSATLLAVAIVPNISVMSFCHLCLTVTQKTSCARIAHVCLRLCASNIIKIVIAFFLKLPFTTLPPT